MWAKSGIVQLGYVVDNLDEAIAHWAGKLQVGPFFVSRHAPYSAFSYEDSRRAPDVSLAFAFWGDINIELIEQHDDAPSLFRDFRQARGPGLQHLAVLSDDIDADTDVLARQGTRVIQRLVNAESGVETRYYDTEHHPGALLELIQRSATLDEGFAFMKAAAANWDRKTFVFGG